jgi:hypothetical protein
LPFSSRNFTRPSLIDKLQSWHPVRITDPFYRDADFLLADRVARVQVCSGTNRRISGVDFLIPAFATILISLVRQTWWVFPRRILAWMRLMLAAFHGVNNQRVTIFPCVKEAPAPLFG